MLVVEAGFAVPKVAGKYGCAEAIHSLIDEGIGVNMTSTKE